MTYKPDICFYHGPNCDDGFGAAYAIWTKWPDIEFIPINHGDIIDHDLIINKNVVMVDYSVKRDVMLELSNKANTIVVIDHHKSAEKELAGFPTFDGSLTDLAKELLLAEAEMDIFVHFDMNHSGAVLAWNFAQPEHGVPTALELIEDRDLWNWKYPATKPFTLVIASEPRDFEHWDEYVIPEVIALVREGEAIEAYQNKLIEQIASNAYIDVFTDGNNKGYSVWHVNTSVLQSEVGNHLIKLFPDTPFVAVWYETKEGSIRYSLRSEDGREDVSVIAASLGGGGHKNAAGCIKENK